MSLLEIVFSSSVENGDVKMLNQDTVKISLKSGMTINDATVITADVIGRNGFIHVHNKAILHL